MCVAAPCSRCVLIQAPNVDHDCTPEFVRTPGSMHDTAGHNVTVRMVSDTCRHHLRFGHFPKSRGKSGLINWSRVSALDLESDNIRICRAGADFARKPFNLSVKQNKAQAYAPPQPTTMPSPEPEHGDPPVCAQCSKLTARGDRKLTGMAGRDGGTRRSLGALSWIGRGLGAPWLHHQAAGGGG